MMNDNDCDTREENISLLVQWSEQTNSLGSITNLWNNGCSTCSDEVFKEFRVRSVYTNPETVLRGGIIKEERPAGIRNAVSVTNQGSRPF